MNASTHVPEWVRMAARVLLGIVLIGIFTSYVGGGLYVFLAFVAVATVGYFVYQRDPTAE